MNLPTVLEALNTIQDNPKATAITLISITAATGLYLYRKSTRAKQSQAETKDSTPILVGGLLQKTPFPHGGPFVAKLEACLRYANFTFKVGIPPTGFSARPPNRKVPGLWYKGELLGDSELIVKRLVKDGEIEDVNSWMDPVSRANARCFVCRLRTLFIGEWGRRGGWIMPMKRLRCILEGCRTGMHSISCL
ncbi:hypothetical protein BCR33DRAFT_169043 [Rhizoclosmatium globosum]|uniref:Thioredoxin-like fold domain-containing protein n=1 Tax=Rhizoclosmatium globosum TaxID=329046 RepID=A0A1Y2CEJ4_9FUNG|nr:hypothetical protein BCR33DRAFT_169043 [Rhizoclosmatium globosum]|eukprot:ORY45473.1 hypothetical protein BCR33DRAFT_169043 [Rhizoclosmatium globosum]